MNKGIVDAVIDRSGGLCENCYSIGHELHHIIYGLGRRKQCERVESVILLCYECHRGTNGVHGTYGHKLDLKLKQKLQQTYFNMGMGDDEVRRWMGGMLY